MSSWGGHPSPSQSSSPSIPPFAEGTGLGRLVLCFIPFSSFRSLALRRKGGIVLGWCWGRAKSSASSRGGHPSPSRSLFHAFPMNHRVFERNMRSRPRSRACLSRHRIPFKRAPYNMLGSSGAGRPCPMWCGRRLKYLKQCFMVCIGER